MNKPMDDFRPALLEGCTAFSTFCRKCDARIAKKGNAVKSAFDKILAEGWQARGLFTWICPKCQLKYPNWLTEIENDG